MLEVAQTRQTATDRGVLLSLEPQPKVKNGHRDETSVENKSVEGAAAV